MMMRTCSQRQNRSYCAPRELLPVVKVPLTYYTTDSAEDGEPIVSLQMDRVIIQDCNEQDIKLTVWKVVKVTALPICVAMLVASHFSTHHHSISLNIRI